VSNDRVSEIDFDHFDLDHNDRRKIAILLTNCSFVWRVLCTFAFRMKTSSKGDITAELMILKTLEGAAFGAKLKEIAGRKEFYALPESPFIYSIGGGNQLSNDPDYRSLLMAAQESHEPLQGV